MTQHTTIRTYGRCPATGKIKYASRADAKRVRERNPVFRDKRPYVCDDCQHVHLGGEHGTQSRAEHRSGNVVGDTMSVTMAAEELNVSTELMGQLIQAGAIDTVTGNKGQTRIPVAEVERLSRLTMRSA